MKKTFTLLFLVLSLPVFSQRSGNNDIDFGFLTQGGFYLFTGARNYNLFADYRRSYKNYFARFRVSYHNRTLGSNIYNNMEDDTSKLAYLWLEAGHLDNFYFKDQIQFTPKSGLKSPGAPYINETEIDFNVSLGYIFKLGKKKRFCIEPSLGYTAYYFRQDIFWLLFNLQFGDYNPDPTIQKRQTSIFSTTRGMVWGPEGECFFRYYFKQKYSIGANVTFGVNKYYDTFYFGGFVGLNF